MSQNKNLDYYTEHGVEKAKDNKNPSHLHGLSSKKSVIIMDEVDGLGAGDRGGVQALTAVIKESMTPIICICNDYENRKLQTLRKNCYMVKFQRPQSHAIIPFILTIAK